MNTRGNFSSSTFPKASELNTKPKLKIPDLSTELFKDQKIFYQYDTSISPPPLSTTSCFIHETVNSDPHLMRSTMYVLPKSPNFYENLNIPFGVSVTPFSFKSDSRRSLQHSVRCLQCLSYANNYWLITNDKVVCNICKHSNDILKICKDPDNISNFLKFPTYEINIPFDQEIKSKNMVDSEYFDQVIYKYPVFIFLFDSSFKFIEDYLVEIKNILNDETFRNLYKKILLMNNTSIFTLDNDELIEYNLEMSPFIPPDVFIETSKLNNNSINLILDLITSKIENKINNLKVSDVLKKISRYSVGSKTVIFSSLLKLEEIPNMSIKIFSNSMKFKNDLIKFCCSESFFDISIEVKTSNGIAKNAVYVDTEVQNFNNVFISSMDCSSTVAYTFYIDDHITDSKSFIQFNIKYTTHEGERKVLILNQSYKVSKLPYDVINSISFDTLFSTFCKYISKDIKNIKHSEEMMVKFLKFYRNSCCKEVSITQFVLPDSAKLLPVLFQSLAKNKIFSCSNINEQARKSNIDTLVKFSVEQNLRFFYPRLFTLTDFYMDQDLTKIQYLRLSMSVIDPSEIYVLENSQKIFLYIGKDVDQNLREALFKNEEEYAVLMKLVDDINGTYGYELPVVVIEEGKSAGEIDFYGYMIEDNMNGVCNYYDYVCELHFKVQKA
ncbi:fibronectin binding protein SFBX [Vairimorpha necatrix]|uniref:Fibronectin binding protein SFBX n=1 Tax=Vairimorpha necatrix TaxID=6039 RepID=A0AAX4JGJ7_9MICR